MVLELKGISHQSNSGEDTGSKALWRILLRLKKDHLLQFYNGPHNLHGGTVSVPEIQLAHELADEEVAILPAPGVSVTDALRSYVETVQVLSRIIED